MKTIKGIDVSGYQSADFSTKGLAFVIVKATEGTSYTNPKMTAQAKHARLAGCVIGFYHFLRPGNMKDQAAYFVKQAASVEGDLLFADWEDAGVSSPQKDQFLAEVKRLRGADHRVGLYCNQNFWLNHDTSSQAGDALWIADYVTAGKPRIDATWRFHQYTDSPLDTNLAAFDDVAALRAWATVGDKPKPPKPGHVDLSNVIAAARRDPGLRQGGTTHPADVRIVEAALHAEGLLSAKYSGDGSFGTTTKTAYAALQRRYDYSGTDANGIPGLASLTRLGKAHNFTVIS